MNKLEQSGNNMQQQYNTLFKKCTAAVMNKDSQRANMYANECAQIKKMVSVILQSQFAIERVSIRIKTIEDFGNVAIEMGPVANVISSLKGQLSGVLPDVSYKLGEIGESLNEMVIGFGEATGTTTIDALQNEESVKILNEAAAVAENQMRERFPTLPETPIPSTEKHSESRFTT
jgi:division protein CdvB (Snf7/Vps24/ESCRT-III family)